MCPRENLAYLKDTLPYTPKELVALEASLLSWIHGCGVLKGYKHAPSSIIEIQDDLKNGVIFCKLVQFIFNKHLPGIFNDPRTETTKVSNLRKALDTLKKEKSMSQKYTWSEKEIVKGNKEHILGLLEDTHLLFDGHPPRQCGESYFDDGPYIGTTKVYDQMNRKPFFYHKNIKNDTFELENDTDEDQDKVRDFLGEARNKYDSVSRDISIANAKAKIRHNNSTHNLRLDASQDLDKGLNTERPINKFEQVPSMINNQIGDDV